MTFYRGDNLQAFDGSPIEVYIDTTKPISKAEVIFNGGSIVKSFENPTSPILVELNEGDTKKLVIGKNVMNLIVYDEHNRKQTCDGALYFTVDREVYIAS